MWRTLAKLNDQFDSFVFGVFSHKTEKQNERIIKLVNMVKGTTGHEKVVAIEKLKHALEKHGKTLNDVDL